MSVPMTQEDALVEARRRWGEQAFARITPRLDIFNQMEVGYYKYRTVPRFLFGTKKEKFPLILGRATDYRNADRFYWEEAFLDANRTEQRRKSLMERAEATKAEILAEYAASRRGGM